MEKNKPGFRLLAALVLMVVMAVLPMLTALWQDAATLGTPVLGEIQTVALNLREHLPGLGLLALMDQEARWQMDVTDAIVLTREEAVQLAHNSLEPYCQAGLLPPALPFQVHTAEVFALSQPGGPSCVAWGITLVAQTKDSYQGEVSLVLDDTTGRIIHINYGGEVPFTSQELPTLLETFAALYFDQLGIEGYPQAAVNDLEGTYIGDSAAAQRYRFGDPEYGEVSVDLYVYQSGFYTISENG